MRTPTLQTLKASIGGGMVLLALGALLAVFQLQQANPAPALTASPAPESPVIEVFFTQPGAAVQDPEVALLAAMDGAQRRLDVATYHFNLWTVRQALLEAQARGVEVRLVVEGDNQQAPEVQELAAAGIPIGSDRGPGLMHHKFVVLDGREVWAGSMNLSYGSVHADSNNLVRLVSAEAARSFEHEFDEMFVSGRFGAASLADTPVPLATLGETEIEILFSPDDGVAGRMLTLVRQAKESVDVLAYTLTLDALAEALIDPAKAGVAVRVVMEGSQASASGSEADRLRQAGLDFRLESTPALLHHKVIIIDRRTVLTGSYNFTRSAEERNDEAVLVIHDPKVAAAYLREFEAIHQAASAG